MESPSAPAHRGRVPWQGLLLAVSLLTFWSPPTTAQLTVASINATEGKDVLLLVHNVPEDLLGYSWYRGESSDNTRVIAAYVIQSQKFIPGPAYSGRETIHPNGSLLLQKVTLNDTGYYTMQALQETLQGDKATGQLHVYPELTKPNITSNNSNPEEHKDSVLLTCESHTEDTTYLWLINSPSLQDSARLELSKDNRTLTLLHVTRNDTGPYECETRNPVSANHSDPYILNVLYGPDAPSILPSDSHYSAGANLRLSCHAASNPPAQYIWLINGRPQQPTQELFIPSITANDSGSYTCIAHNSVTGLNRTTVKNITVYAENDYTGYPVGTIAGIVIGVLVLVALGTALGCFMYHRRTRRDSDKQGLTEHRPPASTPGQGPSGASTSPGPLPSPRTAGPIYEDLLHPSTDVYCRVSPRANGAS
ncbi:carcinoembryonic antigen-related cell adhesion molecule 1-like isoform X2 [Sturnira hondurensis]|uniref:carcinoembryonic antigen-related cell adhesion molecule 1-like isoform X2 n=1 Tax=Sturnira hondurensis TaxID=192404 RepID=UPI0018792B9F|nr:carcinoembryonic antigen-related cell adhesion molecule 1-like isoform X2 [Sturnira hondurensis]